MGIQVSHSGIAPGVPWSVMRRGVEGWVWCRLYPNTKFCHALVGHLEVKYTMPIDKERLQSLLKKSDVSHPSRKRLLEAL